MTFDQKLGDIRHRTACPLHECRRALAEASGDLDLAIQILHQRTPIPFIIDCFQRMNTNAIQDPEAARD